jgi:hypothetical protein
MHVDEALMVLCEGGTLVEDYSDWAGFSFVDGSVDVRVLGLAGRVRNGDEGRKKMYHDEAGIEAEIHIRRKEGGGSSGKKAGDMERKPAGPLRGC